jgi:RimJ/RimL family protein N-acetyltransferase
MKIEVCEDFCGRRVCAFHRGKIVGKVTNHGCGVPLKWYNVQDILGWDVHEKYRGKGLCSKMIKKYIATFGDCVAHVSAWNISSRLAAQRAGMVLVYQDEGNCHYFSRRL